MMSEVVIFLTSSSCRGEALGTIPAMKSSSRDSRSSGTLSISSMLNLATLLAALEASLRSVSGSIWPEPAKGSKIILPSRSVILEGGTEDESPASHDGIMDASCPLSCPFVRVSPNTSASRLRSVKEETTEFCWLVFLLFSCAIYFLTFFCKMAGNVGITSCAKLSLFKICWFTKASTILAWDACSSTLTKPLRAEASNGILTLPSFMAPSRDVRVAIPLAAKFLAFLLGTSSVPPAENPYFVLLISVSRIVNKFKREMYS